MTIRAALYARVSSSGQRDRQTIEGQLRSIRAYVTAQGWTSAGEYIDDGKTARTGHLEARDGFAALLRDADARKFDVVVVVDIDRLTRSDDMLERATVLSPFQRLGIDIVTPSGGRLDLRTVFGELWTTIQAIGAAEENRKRLERTMLGKARVAALGRKPQGANPFGLLYDKATGQWSIDEVKSATVLEAFHRIDRGESCFDVASNFYRRNVPAARGGTWHREKVWKLVTNRVYRGEYVWNRERGDTIKVPAIVPVELWDRVQDRLSANRKRGLRRTRHVYLLESLGVCGLCGAPIGIACGGKDKHRKSGWTPSRYVCTHRHRPRMGEARCTLPHRNVADVDAAIWTAMREQLLRPDAIEDALALEGRAKDERVAWQGDIADAEQRLARLVKAETDLLGRHRRGMVSDAALDAELEAIARERKFLDRQATSARKAMAAAERAQERATGAQVALRDAQDLLSASTPVARQHVLRAVLEPQSVVFGADQIVADLRLGVTVSREMPMLKEDDTRHSVRIRVVA